MATPNNFHVQIIILYNTRITL